MKIIERIEIRNFRSIKKIDIDFDSSVSIFSGVNSCGKTNILRALNLFFNDEVGFEKKLSVSDFFVNKGKTSASISIKVSFNSYESERIKKQKKVPERFSIIKIYKFQAGFFSQSMEVETSDGVSDNQRRNCEQFLTKWVKFHYIPTDRKVFFKKIYNELSEFLGSPFGFKKLKSQFDLLNNNFKDIETSLNTRDVAQLKLSDPLKERLGISKVGYALPEVRNLLKVLDFAIERKSGEKNFVSTEGDGVKFINLLQILDVFDSRYSQEARTRPYVSIWAIDEPENSLEQKNIELFKHEVWNRHSQDKQVFLTSHSPEFLLEPDQAGRNRFYGFENLNGETKSATNKILSTQLVFTEFERQMLIEKMGIGMTREEKIELKKQAEEFRKKSEELKSEILQATKPIVFVEDEYDQIYKIAFLKNRGLECDQSHLEEQFKENSPFLIHSKNCGNELNKYLDQVNVSDVKEKKILGLFDFDSSFNQFNGLDPKRRWSEMNGSEEKGLFKKRKDHPCFFALVLPVPVHRKHYASKSLAGNSALPIELYFSDEVLVSLNSSVEEVVSGVSEKRRIFSGDKSIFWKKLFKLPKTDFESFGPLFKQIDELLGL